MSNYLHIAQVHELTDAMLSGGLNTPDIRDELLTGINLGYVAALPLRQAILDQLRSDLAKMNGVPYLVGGEVPLMIWLENAIHRLRMTHRPEQELFQKTYNEVAAKSETEIPAEEVTSALPGVAEQLEEIIHEDDLLDYGWLRGALDVGMSVARLVVPRMDNGQRVHFPSSNKPIESKGTGWLIGEQHVITNHHVINARSKGEANAGESDLKRQAENATVQFDYDDEGADGVIAEVESLAAWAVWNATPALDFAVLKLNESPKREVLTLSPNALHEAAGGILPVNIIQHPGGNPKALGIRNNLISSLEEWELRYFTDTMRGSSGSPVCNDAWQVIGLHRATRYVFKNLKFQGKETAYVNNGVRIDRIIDHLKEHHAEVWSAIGSKVV